MTRIAIIGAGISGLATAHAIERLAAERSLNVSVTVLEREARTGGKIWSIREEGYLCEWGPNGFLDSKPMTLELCERLGISDQLARSNDNARKRFIYSQGELHRLPENGPMFLQSNLISWRGKLRLAGELFVPPRRDDVDETLAEFARRRLGPEALDKLIGPMVSGIFAGDPETMSLQSCFPRIRELEREYGGLLRAMLKLAKKKKAERKAGKEVSSAAGPGGVLTSFVDGIQSLTNATSARLAGKVRTDAAVVALRPHAGGWELELATGEKLDVELVVSAAPAHALGELLQPLDQELAGLVSDIPYATMNVICCGYARERIARDLDGFGYLIPRKEGRSILGTLWDSSIFPQRAPEGHVLLRSMMGGATNPAAIDLTDAEVLARTQSDLRDIMGITAKPDFVRIFRHPQAIPQYLSGHARRLAAIDDRLQAHAGLFVTGNAFFGVGLNDCVHAANRAAEQVAKRLSVGS
ncbi:MAG: protoporphyrinogen oxidase [Desulfuromonadales bacterium]|nr:protoporphyrinogen oxidase [Desulfuromonadales bacterium]